MTIYSQKNFLLYDSFALTPNNFFMLWLVQANMSMLSHILHNFSKNFVILQPLKNYFQNHFVHFFLALCPYQCMAP